MDVRAFAAFSYEVAKFQAEIGRRCTEMSNPSLVYFEPLLAAMVVQTLFLIWTSVSGPDSRYPLSLFNHQSPGTSLC